MTIGSKSEEASSMCACTANLKSGHNVKVFLHVGPQHLVDQDLPHLCSEVSIFLGQLHRRASLQLMFDAELP